MHTLRPIDHSATHHVGPYPAPGRILNVGGHPVHCVAAGAGAPTVVFEAGMGSNHLDWQAVRSRLAATTHAFFYDRAGLGWSGPRPEPRTPAQVVDELEATLAAAQIHPPYVLVGHSMGARYIRIFARRHRQEVVGMVVVDGYNEAFDTAIGPAALRSFVEGRARFYGVIRRLDQLGIVRVLGGRLVSLLGPDFRAMPAAERTRYARVLARAQAMATATDELRRSGAANEELADASLGDLPLVVLSHATPFPDAVQEEAWQASQQELCSRSTRGTLVSAQGAAHSVMLARPDLVVEAINAVLAEAAAVASPAPPV